MATEMGRCQMTLQSSGSGFLFCSVSHSKASCAQFRKQSTQPAVVLPKMSDIGAPGAFRVQSPVQRAYPKQMLSHRLVVVSASGGNGPFGRRAVDLQCGTGMIGLSSLATWSSASGVNNSSVTGRCWTASTSRANGAQKSARKAGATLASRPRR
jgi:hypothetical protein